MNLQIIQTTLELIWLGLLLTYSNAFQCSLYSKYRTSRWYENRIYSLRWDDDFCTNMPCSVLEWFWALLLTLGVPPLTHLGVGAPPHHRLSHLPFPCCILLAPTIRTEKRTDALPVTWKMTLLSVCGKPQPFSEQKHKNEVIFPWAIPFRVFIYLLLT